MRTTENNEKILARLVKSLGGRRSHCLRPFVFDVMFRKGFTLIEIMIVVAIIAVLAALAIPNFVSYRKTSQMRACLSNLKLLDHATEAYLIKNNAPNDAEITFSMLVPSSTEEQKSDKYFIVNSIPGCPSGGEYQYDKNKHTWFCSLGGDENANGGFPHGKAFN